MNSIASACIALVGIIATVYASPTDRVIIAAMKLSEQPNYSWFSAINDQSSSYELEGRTTAAGITWMRMPMISSIGRRLGRETDTQLEALFHGRATGIIRIGNAWKSVTELPPPRYRPARTRTRSMMRGSASAGGFGVAGRRSSGAATPWASEEGKSPTYTSLQFGVTHPHEELAIIVSSFTRMQTEGAIVTGTLSQLGAALLLVRAEQEDVEPLASAGEFKLWLEDDVVTKYQLKLEGVVSYARKKFNVQVDSITTLSDIGRTQISVPDEARAKLQSLGRPTS